MNAIAIQLSGDERVLRMFEELPSAAQNRVLKPLIRDGGKTLSSAIKDEASVQSGLMKTAVGASTLKNYGAGTLFITAGVRRGYRVSVGRTARGKIRHGSIRSNDLPAGVRHQAFQDPAKYLHLVTRGRKAVSATKSKVLYDVRSGRFLGTSVAAAKPNPFVDRAFEHTKTTVVDSISTKAVDLILSEAKSLLGD